MRLLGVVLAGGRSRRFGSDKAQAMLGERTLLEHAKASLAGHVDDIVIVGPRGIPDAPRPDLGPLGGIAGALRFARLNGFTAILSTACDIPVLPSSLFPKLIEAAPAYLRSTPVIGCWPADLGPKLEIFLEGENRSVRAWAAAISARAVEGDVPFNINTTADLDAPKT